MRGDLHCPKPGRAARLIRIAAVGDVHVGRDGGAFSTEQLERLRECADVLLLAGDLTQNGHVHEARNLAQDLARAEVPVVAVLGNHDYHHGEERGIREALEAARVRVLEGEGTVIQVRDVRVGVGGTKGFGGGFPGACGSEFGEDEMKAFMRHSRLKAEQLTNALEALECDVKLALMHYAPVDGTLAGERLEIYPFLGSYYLGEAVDKTGCLAAFHGHAHAGTERAVTAGGVPVRNVARPVIRLAFKIYTLSADAEHGLYADGEALSASA